MEKTYKYSECKDKKITYKWVRLVALVKYDEALEEVHYFVSNVGVSSYLKVLYDILG